jgi:hypothetical protein
MRPEIEAIGAVSHDLLLIGQWAAWALMALGSCLLLFMVVHTVRCRPVWNLRFARDWIADEPGGERRLGPKERRVGSKERPVGSKERRVGSRERRVG